MEPQKEYRGGKKINFSKISQSFHLHQCTFGSVRQTCCECSHSTKYPHWISLTFWQCHCWASIYCSYIWSHLKVKFYESFFYLGQCISRVFQQHGNRAVAEADCMETAFMHLLHFWNGMHVPWNRIYNLHVLKFPIVLPVQVIIYSKLWCVISI